MWPQDVFKEARSHDHLEAKNDMETHVRSRKLPLTRKIYAFYHAPIVKFWSNTVRENRACTYTYTCSQFCATIHYGCLSEWDSWYLEGRGQGVSDQDQPLGTQCFFALKGGVQKREVPARPSQVSEMRRKLLSSSSQYLPVFLVLDFLMYKFCHVAWKSCLFLGFYSFSLNPYY